MDHRRNKERRMGRMLDTLNQSELPHRERPALTVAAPPPIRVIADDDTGDEAEPIALAVPPLPAALVEPAELEPDEDESAPFIEVGGPRSQVDASPEVLAFPASRRPPHLDEPPAAADDDALALGGTSEIWCSWTLRPGMKMAK